MKVRAPILFGLSIGLLTIPLRAQSLVDSSSLGGRTYLEPTNAGGVPTSLEPSVSGQVADFTVPDRELARATSFQDVIPDHGGDYSPEPLTLSRSDLLARSRGPIFGREADWLSDASGTPRPTLPGMVLLGIQLARTPFDFAGFMDLLDATIDGNQAAAAVVEPPTAAPEPATMGALAGIGLAFLCLAALRQREFHVLAGPG